ncbi:putative potassium channel regulatory protein sup-10 [Trichostrongylus colubriformis]|uniref:Potassium channel regulatory protein sup-10 n=1 Tax=Trichostrongylus colubriformis TaxID=6319 RepID=A0AAN8FGD4_TRICO
MLRFSLLVAISLAEPVYRRSISSEQLSSLSDTADKSFLRTTAIIEQRTEYGRLVLLLCRRNCPRLRSLIPQWVRDINEDMKYHGTDIIGYHYYTYKKPLPFVDEEDIEQFPTLVYIIAKTPTYYTGNITSQKSVTQWIVSLDNVEIKTPQNVTALDQLITSTSNCSEKLLVFVNDARQCPLPYWGTVARAAYMYGVQPVHLSIPLPASMSVVLYKRLPLLVESQCQQMFLIHQDSYSIQFQDYTPYAVRELIDLLLPNATEECPPLHDTMWFSVMTPLTELQMIYFSGEHDLVKLEHKQAYVLVGLTGGIAVIALAMSIFWGLNGSGFAN